VLAGVELRVVVPAPAADQGGPVWTGKWKCSQRDLPIFRSLDVSSPNTVNVRDLHRCIESNAAERGRT
jgi:hypothetical protein